MPNVESDDPTEVMQKLLNVLRGVNASVIASALVSASNRPHSIAQVLELRRDVENTLFPKPKDKAFLEWAKTKAERVSRICT